MSFTLGSRGAWAARRRNALRESPRALKRLAAAVFLVTAFGVPAGSAAGPSVSASRLLGAEVVDRTGEDLGAITDLAVDLSAGVVRYAMVRSDGSTVTGPPSDPPGEKVFGIRLQALRPGLQRGQLVLRDREESASSGASADGRMMRASTLIGLPVVLRDGRRLGDIVDLGVDLDTGEVLHAAIEVKAPGAQRLTLPLAGLRFPGAGAKAVLEAAVR